MLTKNQIIPLEITSIASDGNGIGHYHGIAVFVPFAAPGDQLQVRIVKVLSRYCYGIIHQLERPAEQRIPSDCPVYGRCGGCALRHITYQAELAIKAGWVSDALRRIGGFEHTVLPILPSPLVGGYRNKAQYPIGQRKDGKAFCGFFTRRSHLIVPAEDCRLQPESFSDIARAVCQYIDQSDEGVYDENTGQGLFRHLYLRRGETSGEIMVCLVATRHEIPHPEALVTAILAVSPKITSILLNVNSQATNVILGNQTYTLWGKDTIQDILCGVEVCLSPLSFYQVNHKGAEILYQTAAQLAALEQGEILLDLYCGTGTVGLAIAGQSTKIGQLIGVDVVESAIRNAWENARRIGMKNCRFLCADAAQASQQFASEGLHPHVVVVDPPRKGCNYATLEAIAIMAPRRIVYISCNPATQARDLKILAGMGYHLTVVQPVDMFPRTAHVETVALLRRKDIHE